MNGLVANVCCDQGAWRLRLCAGVVQKPFQKSVRSFGGVRHKIVQVISSLHVDSPPTPWAWHEIQAWTHEKPCQQNVVLSGLLSG